MNLSIVFLMLLWKVLFVSSQNPSFRPSLKPHTPIIIKPQGWLSIQYYSSTDCSQASSSQGQFISVGVCITSSKGGLIYSVVIIDSENIQITRTKYSDSYCTSGTRNGYAQQTISTHSCLVSTSSWYSVLPLSEITGADFGKVSYLSQTAIPSGFYTGPATSYYSLWDNNCQQPVAYNYFNSKYCLNTIANQASSQLTCQGIKTYSTLNCISASVSSSVPSAHFNCNSSTSIIQTDSSLLASSFCNIFHTLEPTSLPSVEPTMTPSSATPILPSKMPHSPSYAPIWLTKTGWSSFNFYSSSDCITSSFIATESVQSNLCIATTYGSYKYRFQQSISNDFEILFSNYSDNNCKNTRFYNHYPSYLPIQSCIPVSSLVSVLPYFSDMSNMYVNISLGMTTSSAPSMSQSVVNTYYSLLDTHCTTPIKYLYATQQYCSRSGSSSSNGLYVAQSCTLTQFFTDDVCSTIIQSLPTTFKTCNYDSVTGLYISTACGVPILSSSISSSSSSADINTISIPVIAGLAGCIGVILLVLMSVYYLLFRLRKEHINAPVSFDHIYKQQQKHKNGQNNDDHDNVSVASTNRSVIVSADQRIVNPLGQKSVPNRSPRTNNYNNNDTAMNISTTSSQINSNAHMNNENSKLGQVQLSTATTTTTTTSSNQQVVVDTNTSDNVAVASSDSARLSELSQQTSTPAESSTKNDIINTTTTTTTAVSSPIKQTSPAQSSSSATAIDTIKKVKKAAGKAAAKANKEEKSTGTKVNSNPSPQRSHAQGDSPRVNDDRQYTDSIPYPVSVVDDYRMQRKNYPNNYAYGNDIGDSYPSSDYFYHYPAPSTQPRPADNSSHPSTSSSSGYPPFQSYR